MNEQLITKTDKEVSDFIKEMHRLYNTQIPKIGNIEANNLCRKSILAYVKANLLNGSQVELLRYSVRVFWH